MLRVREDPGELHEAAAEPHAADHPRVLIVAPTILNTVKGGGVTLGRLFRGWPIDRIAQVHADILPPDLSACREYFSIAGPFYSRGSGDAMRRFLYLLGYVTRTGEHGLYWARMSSRLGAWLDRVRPDVVFGQTGSPAFLRLTERIVDRTGARLILHASDDWVRDWPATSLGRSLPLVGPAIARSVERDWRRLVSRATARLAISRPMAETYRERYGGDWLPFANAIDLREWPPAPPRSGAGPFRILYSGSVIPTSQLEGLRDLARVTAGSDIELVISTGDPVPPGAELGAPHVRVIPPAPQSDLPARLASADALFIPSVFSEPARRFYELSIPGKVAEYLASSRPVLVYAPATSALARSAASDGWAELVDRRDDALLSVAVRRLRDPVRRSALAERARAVAERDHDLNLVRPAFQAVIRSAAGRTR